LHENLLPMGVDDWSRWAMTTDFWQPFGDVARLHFVNSARPLDVKYSVSRWTHCVRFLVSYRHPFEREYCTRSLDFPSICLMKQLVLKSDLFWIIERYRHGQQHTLAKGVCIRIVSKSRLNKAEAPKSWIVGEIDVEVKVTLSAHNTAFQMIASRSFVGWFLWDVTSKLLVPGQHFSGVVEKVGGSASDLGERYHMFGHCLQS
jgi:hypothetical protein